ncbi:hypothetical protein BMS_2672 [Halobacteriovorax marinus SJ]|uniref:Lipoprotein n=1 Tax=Halobacteriovorax marinus (strain ATCC BAA-682 / DSM 15412 / SJ) TaxID=862908 RepID=E1WXD4_HALMS|nr:hypothetical protein [Halobacteriovorax marinus]CBW27451.1 hypothetical protein BMS_2672 [Halobacteriovorax marinus SJ]
MSKFWTVFICLFTLISCGVKKNSRSESDLGTAYIEASLSSRTCNEEQREKIEGRIIALEEYLSRLSISSNMITKFDKSSESGNSSLISPLILSEKSMTGELDELEEFRDSNQELTLSTNDYQLYSQRIKKLRINFDRWSFHQCHLTSLIDNSAQELNDFIELEASFCTEDCFVKERLSKTLTAEEKREKTVNICSLFQRRNYCKVHYDIATIFDGEDEFIKENLKSAKVFFQKNIFGMSEGPLNIECQKNEKYEITIPIYSDQASAEVINAISQYWKRDDIELKFVNSVDGVRVVNISSGPSRVAINELQTIYLNSNVVGMERVKTIAHEFGHSLGFKDCYVEYYDSRSQELIYYELERDEGNLMCSLEYGHKIPDKYLDKIISQYCH